MEIKTLRLSDRNNFNKAKFFTRRLLLTAVRIVIVAVVVSCKENPNVPPKFPSGLGRFEDNAGFVAASLRFVDPGLEISFFPVFTSDT